MLRSRIQPRQPSPLPLLLLALTLAAFLLPSQRMVVLAREAPIVAAAGGARYSSAVFVHLTHTGGSTLRGLFRHACSGAQLRTLECWESQVSGHGKRVPSVSVLRGGRPLDALFGHFPFDPPALRRVMRQPYFAVTVLADPYEVARSDYFYHRRWRQHGSPDAFLRDAFPRGLSWHTQRLGGEEVRKEGTDAAYEASACRAALDHLASEVAFVTEKRHLGGGAVAALHEALRQNVSDWAALPPLVEGALRRENTISAGTKSAGFDANVTVATRAAFDERSRCAYELLVRARTLPAYCPPPDARR